MQKNTPPTPHPCGRVSVVSVPRTPDSPTTPDGPAAPAADWHQGCPIPSVLNLQNWKSLAFIVRQCSRDHASQCSLLLCIYLWRLFCEVNTTSSLTFKKTPLSVNIRDIDSAKREREREKQSTLLSGRKAFPCEWFFFQASLAGGSVHKPWGFTAGRAPSDALVTSRTMRYLRSSRSCSDS